MGPPCPNPPQASFAVSFAMVLVLNGVWSGQPDGRLRQSAEVSTWNVVPAWRKVLRMGAGPRRERLGPDRVREEIDADAFKALVVAAVTQNAK
jgi:hypothetical protein